MSPKGWRVSSNYSGGFDELFTSLCHLEMMGPQALDVHLGKDVQLHVWVDKGGVAHVRHLEGRILGPHEEPR